MFQFDNSYAQLPERFFASVYPEPVEGPVLLKFNEALAGELRIAADLSDPQRLAAILAGNVVPPGAMPIAMAYAGHQFGSFVPQLGDGRAILLGEVVDVNGVRRDIQLKGAGPTPFSRRGDGRAALGPVLREYIISEAMNGLGVRATRALAAVATGEPVYRETPQQGAIFVRVASSHVRIGTFQYFAARQDVEALGLLVDYVIDRHYPQLKSEPNRALALLRAVSAAQAELVARWMGIGFIHGVMNTDNMTLSGETIDFGPCAFLDEYDPMKVFSSIDQMGRYAYRNQPGIAQWNIARLAECLLPLIEADEDQAALAANAVLTEFGQRFQTEWLAVFSRKIGLSEPREGDGELVQGLLAAMHAGEADFTRTFRRLCAVSAKGVAVDRTESGAVDDGTGGADGEEGATEEGAGGTEAMFLSSFTDGDKAREWLGAWRARLVEETLADDERGASMRAANPAVIPRNHKVEEALAAANYGDLSFFERLLEALATPFEDRPDFDAYTVPPTPEERVLQTFCGT